MAREPKRAVRRVCACVAVVLVAFGAGASAAQALPASFWGVVPQATPTPEQFQRLGRGGVGTVRIPVLWPAVQPIRNGPMTWSGVD